MSDTLTPPHDEIWKERLGLDNRSAPEFYKSAAMVADTPHALAIRTALDELGVSGIFCVQGVPTIAILNLAGTTRRAWSICMAHSGTRDWPACFL